MSTEWAHSVDMRSNVANLDADGKMTALDRLEAALKRLAVALDHLEAAGERRSRADLLRVNLEDELAVMQDDRSRLAVELDGAIARTNALELANEEVARKLNAVGAAIKTVLAKADTRES